MRPRWLVACVVAACSGDPAAPPDAGDAAPPDGAALPPPAEPALPAAATLAPCAAGWREVPSPDPDGVATCEPWPQGGQAACAAGFAHFPGEPACARVGGACPAGEWAEDLPAAATVLYVKQGAAPGGDGSALQPFPTIGEATAAATAGTVVAVGKGTFDEAVTLGAGVTLWGACVAETVIGASTASATAGTVTVTGAGAAVRNLTLGGNRAGLWVAATGSAQLDDVEVAGAASRGVLVDGGGLVATTLVVRDGDRGLEVRAGGSADVARAVVERTAELAVSATTGATLALTDAAIVDTQGNAAGDGGIGLYLEYGADVEARRVVLERNREAGILEFDAGSTLVLEDVVVRDTAPNAGGDGGTGLIVRDGARAEAARALFDRNHYHGLLAVHPDTVLVLHDVVVRDTRPLPASQLYGRGLEVKLQARAEVTRCAFEGNSDFGVLVTLGGDLAAEDVTARDTDTMAGQPYGRGLAVEFATATVARGLFERNHDTGVAVGGDATVATLADVTIRDTLGSIEGLYGRGLNAQGGAVVTVTRALLERNREASVLAHGGATVLQATDLQVLDTLERDCAATTCVGQGSGFGVVAVEGGSVELTRFVVSRSALAGGLIARGAGLDLHVGLVASNPIGVNIQVEGFDFARLSDQVEFRDNGVNLDAQMLPVPEVGL